MTTREKLIKIRDRMQLRYDVQSDNDVVYDAVYTLLCTMIQCGDSNITASSDDIGLYFTGTSFDAIDLNTGALLFVMGICDEEVYELPDKLTREQIGRLITVGRRMWKALNHDEQEGYYNDCNGTIGFVQDVARVLHFDLGGISVKDFDFVHDSIVGSPEQRARELEQKIRKLQAKLAELDK